MRVVQISVRVPEVDGHPPGVGVWSQINLDLLENVEGPLGWFDEMRHALAAHARGELLIAVPQWVAQLHDQHLTFEISLTPAVVGGDNHDVLDVAYMVRYSWLLSWLPLVARANEGDPAMQMSVARLRVPVETLRDTVLKMEQLGWFRGPYQDHHALQKSAKEMRKEYPDEALFLWGAGQQVVTQHLVEGPASDYGNYEGGMDSRLKGMEQMRLKDIGAANSLNLLAQIFRVWGPCENPSLRSASSHTAFYDVNLAMLTVEGLAMVSAPAAVSLRLKETFSHALLDEVFWAAEEETDTDRANEQAVSFTEASIEMFYSPTTEAKIIQFKRLFKDALSKEDFAELRLFLSGDAQTSTILRFETLSKAVLPKETDWASLRAMQRTQRELRKFSGVVQGHGSVDDKLEQIVAMGGSKGRPGADAHREARGAPETQDQDASAAASGSNTEWADLLGHPAFVAFANRLQLLVSGTHSASNITECMLRSNIPMVIKFALNGKQVFTTFTSQQQEVVNIMKRGRTHLVDYGVDKRPYENLHLMLEDMLKQGLTELQYHHGSLFLPREEVSKLAVGNYAEVKWEAILEATHKAAGLHWSTEGGSLPNQNPDLYDDIRKIGSIIFEALGHGGPEQAGSFDEVYQTFVNMVNMAKKLPQVSRAHILAQPSFGALALLKSAWTDAQRVRSLILGPGTPIALRKDHETTSPLFVPPEAQYYALKAQAKQSNDTRAMMRQIAPELYGAGDYTSVQSYGVELSPSFGGTASASHSAQPSKGELSQPPFVLISPRYGSVRGTVHGMLCKC